VPERLLDYQTAPLLVILLRKSRVAKLLGDEREERRAGREIKQAVPAGPFLLLGLAELFCKSRIKLRVLEIPGNLEKSLDEPVPALLIHTARGVFLDVFSGMSAKFVGGELLDGNADDHEFLGEQIPLGEIIDRGNQFPLGQIAARAEDHHGARRGRFA
jgi:hypothetical protein